MSRSALGSTSKDVIHIVQSRPDVRVFSDKIKVALNFIHVGSHFCHLLLLFRHVLILFRDALLHFHHERLEFDHLSLRVDDSLLRFHEPFSQSLHRLWHFRHLLFQIFHLLSHLFHLRPLGVPLVRKGESVVPVKLHVAVHILYFVSLFPGLVCQFLHLLFVFVLPVLQRLDVFVVLFQISLVLQDDEVGKGGWTFAVVPRSGARRSRIRDSRAVIEFETMSSRSLGREVTRNVLGICEIKFSERVR